MPDYCKVYDCRNYKHINKTCAREACRMPDYCKVYDCRNYKHINKLLNLTKQHKEAQVKTATVTLTSDSLC